MECRIWVGQAKMWVCMIELGTMLHNRTAQTRDLVHLSKSAQVKHNTNIARVSESKSIPLLTGLSPEAGQDMLWADTTLENLLLLRG